MIDRTPLLPIEVVRDAVLDAAEAGPVVVSAPTGSGKSTQIPRWLGSREPVIVVEPRRVACRALAARVAELEGCRVGEGVGYAVRDDRRAGRDTRVLFATPGVALRMVASGDPRRLILDEFHERALDLDLLLALARRAGRRPIVMSATVDGDRIAAHMGGPHVRGEGRLFDVERRWSGSEGPTDRDLVARVTEALEVGRDAPGDVLIFLPGKAEIAAVATAIQGRFDAVHELHGAMNPGRQNAALRPGVGRRAVVATNVAETSLTIPGVGLVVDSGLVRRTAYHGGRGYLTLLPIAEDAADQRAGRAGRLGPGVCVRMWRRSFKLQDATPPAMQRESLVPLVLGALAAGIPRDEVAALPFLDPPPDYALAAAFDHLERLGALTDGGLSARGRTMFRLPVDADLGRLLVEAQDRGTLTDVLPLCAALSTHRRLFIRRPEDPRDDLRGDDDAVGFIRAVRIGDPETHGLDHKTLDEARRAERRFRDLFDVTRIEGDPPVDRRALAETLLAAWPGCAHVARRRKKHVAWAAGGTELSLGRGVELDAERTDAILVLSSRAFTKGTRNRRLEVTAAMPVPLAWLRAAGLGEPRVASANLTRGRLVAKVEQVYAGKVLGTDEQVPSGSAARAALLAVFRRGSLFPGAYAEAERRHTDRTLAARLDGTPVPPSLDEWLATRIDELGVESGDDIALMDAEDLLPEVLPPEKRARLDKDYPRELAIGDARYRIAYAPASRTATLHQVGGTRKTPPPELFLPRLPGWTLKWEFKNRVRVLRG